MSAGLRGGRGDVLRGSHGDVAGVESGASSVERSMSEHGNRPWSAPLATSPAWRGGWAHRLPTGQGRGGAAVVVAGVTTCRGGRESRSQGEGRQWFREVIGDCDAERRGTEWCRPSRARPHRRCVGGAVAAGIGDAGQPSPSGSGRSWPRGSTPVPNPGSRLPEPTRRQRPWRARCGESRTPGSASGLGKRTSSNAGTAPQADSSLSDARTRRRTVPRVGRSPAHVACDVFTRNVELLLGHSRDVRLMLQPGQQVHQGLLLSPVTDRDGVEVNRHEPVEEHDGI